MSYLILKVQHYSNSVLLSPYARAVNLFLLRVCTWSSGSLTSSTLSLMFIGFNDSDFQGFNWQVSHLYC